MNREPFMVIKTPGLKAYIPILFVMIAAYAEQKAFADQSNPCCCPKLAPSANPDSTVRERKAFFKIMSGASFSQKADISVDLTFWDPALQGYNNDLGTAPIIGAGFGYQFLSFLSADVSVAYRWNYEYKKFQTTPPNPTTPQPLPSKTRHFDLDSTSVIFTARFHGKGIDGCFYTADSEGSYIAPVLGAGIGFTYHRVSNFFSKFAPTSITKPEPGAGSIGSSTSKTSFTYQLEAGAEYKYKGTWGVTVGYRWFDAGKFKTPNHIIGGTGLPGNPLAGSMVPPWTGKLRAHEVFAELAYYF